jgi:beta-glucosidase
MLALSGLSFISCSHPEIPKGGAGASSASATSSTGTGTSATGTSATGTGTGSGTGSGGSGTGSGGAGPGGGTGGTDAGSGGHGGDIIVDRDGGVDASTPPPKTSCGDSPYSDKWSPGYAQDPTVLARVQSVVGSMSVTEKADQMRGTNPGNGQNFNDIFRTPDNPNKSIRGFLFRDGPRGVNLASQLSAGKTGYSTSFPAPMARGAAFDMDLEYRIGVAIGDETVASGNTIILAPTTNVLRHPAWGRAQETYGEDPFLLGRLGTAFVAGAQEYVPACAKHYAANNIENGRDSLNATMDEQTLRELYARHFEMMIKDGGVACVMAAYNLVNGTKSTQNKHLLTDLLRTDFGFKGFVLSDWWAMPGGQNASLPPDTRTANAAPAVQAGMDMELPWSLNFQQLEAITGAGRPLAETDITRAASRILEQKFRFKVAETNQPIGLKSPKTTLSGQGAIENNADNIKLAEEAAEKSITLLKNDNNTLPLKRTALKTIAVIGADVPYRVVNTDLATGTIRFALDVRTGDLGSSRVFADPAKSTGPTAGIQASAGAGINVVSGSSASLADTADFVVVMAGLTPEDEGEEYTGAGDRKNFLLDGKSGSNAQNNLIRDVALKNKPMVVVLEGGSVIDMPWLDQVPAVVMAWYPGMRGGAALGKLLFGDVNFSGKLPVTWPKKWEDEPTFSAGATTAMDYYLGYRHFDNKSIVPLFPFGHGLSYAKFEYKNLGVPCSDVTKNGVVNITVDVTNSGAVAGDEVVFLFVSYPGATVRRPAKELKGFYRVSLDAGLTKRVSIPLRIADLKYWDTAGNGWQVASGPVEVKVGPSAANLPLADMLTVK